MQVAGGKDGFLLLPVFLPGYGKEQAGGAVEGLSAAGKADGGEEVKHNIHEGSERSRSMGKNKVGGSMTVKEVFQGARSVLPLMQKAEIVAHCAERCIDRVVVNTGEKFRGDTPPMYRENGQRKRRYLLGVLVRGYLVIDFDGCEGDPWLMSADDYDRLGGLTLLNRIDRMKKEGDVLRDKAFDLLADFRDLEKMLNTEIYANLAVMNDVVARMNMAMQSAVTPESLQELTAMAEELKKTADDMRNATEK